MTFLNPFMLFGLAAASIPLLIHLLSIRKLRTVEFSSLRFLKELQRSSLRRVKIRQWLLLALRTLLIIALVLAFARPALRGSFAGFAGGRATTAMVLLLDDSPSTAARNDHGEIFAQLKEAARRVGAVAQTGDEMYLSPLSEEGKAGTVPALRTVDDLAKALAPLHPSAVRGDFRMAVQYAAARLGQTAATNREVYLLTDAQANQFALAPSGKDSTTSLTGLHVFVVHPSAAQGTNGAVNSADVLTGVVSRLRPVDLQVGVATPGSTGSISGVASVYFDGARVAQHGLSLPPGGTTTFQTRFVPRRSGIQSGYVQLQDDALELDNRRYFTLTVPEKVHVLLVGNRPSDTRYPYLGLTLGGDSTYAGTFSVETITGDAMASVDPNSYDVVCLCDVSRLSRAASEPLGRFIRAGGGLLLFAGDTTAAGSADASALLEDLGIQHAPGVSSSPPRANVGGELSFGRVEMDHPLFEGMFQETPGRRRPPLTSPTVYRASPLRVGERGRTIIALSNGEPFLAEFNAGAGRVLVLTVDAAGTMSTFPASALFAPLLYRSMIYLSDAARTVPPLTVGNPIEMHLRLTADIAHAGYGFVSPSGLIEKVIPEIQSTSGLGAFRSHPTIEVGIYTLTRSASSPSGSAPGVPGLPLAAVAVNVDTAESDLRQADASRILAFFRQRGLPEQDLQVLLPDQQMSQSIEQSRFGVELWRLFLGAALLLGLLEIGIGNVLRRRERVGEDQAHR
jgi:hypothetical protein